MNHTRKQDYVETILKLYTELPQTPAQPSRIDRRLAEELYQQQIDRQDVEAAMWLATARRLLRPDGAPKLGPIRSLHYFLPAIDEIRNSNIAPGYLEYLRRKVAASRQRCLPSSGNYD